MQNQKRSAGAGSSGAQLPPSKRRANGDDEDDLDALLMDEEDMMADEVITGGPEPLEDGVDSVLEGTAAAESYAKAWRRPNLPPLNPQTDGIDFQQLEADWEVCGVASI